MTDCNEDLHRAYHEAAARSISRFRAINPLFSEAGRKLFTILSGSHAGYRLASALAQPKGSDAAGLDPGMIILAHLLTCPILKGMLSDV